ncbi:MAG: MMPL family transporter [Syntrophobacterales bacterium]|nr:MMPL family transporter [Syntrophobacterales bacterium]
MAKFTSPAPDGLWTTLIKRLAWPIIILSLVLTGLSVYYSLTHLRFSLSRTELVASDLHLIRLTQELEREFGERDQFVVVVDNRDKGRSIAFAEALAEQLRRHRDRFPELFYRVDPEPFRKWALQYLKLRDLEELRAKLTEHRHILEAIAAEPTLVRFFQVVNQEITRAMISEVFTSFLEDKEEEPIPDLTLFNATLRELERSLTGQGTYRSPLKTLLPGDLGDLSQEGYFFTDNDRYLLFLVTTRQDGFTNTNDDLALLRAEVAAVQARFPDLVVGVTGPAALSADEMAGAFADINLASWLSFFLQVAVMVVFFRSLKRPLVQGVVLAVGIAWTMGVATLVVGRLNILSIVFAPLMLGICVDFGIHWYSRLEEEQGSLPHCHDQIFERTIRGAGPGNFYAALAALVSILPLAFTGFQGLEELGIIVSLGILAYLPAIFVLLPALAYVTEGCRHRQDRSAPPPPAAPEPFFSLNWARPEVVVALGVLVTVLGTIGLWHVPFDLNPLRLQNQRTESVVWELKILQESRYSSSYGTMVTTDLAELPRKVAELKTKPTVSHVESILSFLPEDPESKLPLIADLAPLLTQVRFAPPPASEVEVDLAELGAILGRIRFKLSQAKESDWKPGAKPAQEQLDEANLLLARLVPLLQGGGPELAPRAREFQRHLFADFRDKWDLLVSNLNSGTPALTDLPQAVRQRFVSPRDHYLIRIFPSIDIWDPEPLGRFVADLQSVDPNVVGDPVLLYVFNFAFKNACLWAAGVALLAIFLLLWFLLRSLSFALLALIPLIVGTALTLCLMWLLGLTFNQANVLFLPLILGEGIEYGIIILVRWKLEATARAITLPRSTAKGVALASLTTAFGFGSMMISGHQGTFSLGLLSTVGSLSVLAAALTVLPAFLRLMERLLLPTPVSCPRPVASMDE